jgi:hypothetical protein
MNVKYTLQFDTAGHTATSGDNEHIQEMIEQVLLTSPGERVNRPGFGSGLLQLLFEGQSEELIMTSQFLVQSALQQWLGDLIEVNDVQVESEDSTISIKIVFTVRKTKEQLVANISR